MTISRVLVANRGEIARRVFRSCRSLGIGTVAVFADPDADAPHVAAADVAVRLPGTAATDTYLRADLLIDAARRSGADAVHPGYGFLSENAAFARVVEGAGLTWIGPSPDAIRLMGNKIDAKRLMADAGVPVLPELDPAAVTAADLPVLIKAAAGGGGRGMRIVHTLADLPDALATARVEAAGAFGDPSVFCEPYLPTGHHVEVQILADMHGTIWTLGERECSIQRRHQKVIEEAPSPLVDRIDGMRALLFDAAHAAAKAIDYTGAGTVEFLADDTGRFFFLEMNTRLQVEHPATEAVLGRDLVALQLQVAAGEPLGFGQEDVRLDGHAIEVRVNAEDPAGGKFLPSPGTITKFRGPDGIGVRVDAGYEQGDTVSQFYDNLIAKIIVWGRDREEARRRMVRALRETEIEGVATTIPADIAILEHADFIAVEHSTNWVAQKLDLSGVASYAAAPPAESGEPGRVQRDVDVEVDGRRYQVKLWVPDVGPAVVAGRPAARPRPSGAGAHGHGGGASGNVTVPMQGTIVKVLVAVGDEVEAGQAVTVLEAMKMENNITAESSGTVTEVRVKPGDAVGAGDVVIVID